MSNEIKQLVCPPAPKQNSRRLKPVNKKSKSLKPYVLWILQLKKWSKTFSLDLNKTNSDNINKK